MLPVGTKIGPQRTTKNAQKLKLLPNPEAGEDGEESGRDVYSQFTRIKDPTARRDAARLGKADRERLPRVTAYCTANAYRLDALMKFLKSRARTRGASPKQFDECIYSPYNYGKSKTGQKNGKKAAAQENTEAHGGNDPTMPTTSQHGRDRRHSDSVLEVDESTHQRREDLLDMHNSIGDTSLPNSSMVIPDHPTPSSNIDPPAPPDDPANNPDFDTQVHTPEVFLFEYGTVVIWGMTLQQEQRFLKDVSKFEAEKLADEDVQTENFNFYYTREYQARIYNDFISLREKRNYMSKLAISHALAQSVKVGLPLAKFSDSISAIYC